METSKYFEMWIQVSVRKILDYAGERELSVAVRVCLWYRFSFLSDMRRHAVKHSQSK